jgi:hypothetical protein
MDKTTGSVSRAGAQSSSTEIPTILAADRYSCGLSLLLRATRFDFPGFDVNRRHRSSTSRWLAAPTWKDYLESLVDLVSHEK